MKTLIASDGYEYADITQRILGEPLDNGRNRQIRKLREAGYKAEEVRVFYTQYDKAKGPHFDKYASAWNALGRHRTKP